QNREELALGRVKRGEIPEQDMDAQLGAVAYQCRKKIAERLRVTVLRRATLADERGAAVNVPAENEDVRTRLEHGGARGAVIARGVDQHAGSGRGALPPDGLRAHQHGGGKCDGT